MINLINNNYENDLFLNKAINLKQVFSKKIEINYATLFLSKINLEVVL